MNDQENRDQINPATHLPETTKPQIVNISGYHSKKKSNDGVWMEMKDPVSGDGTGIHLLICGQDSDQHKKRIRQIRDQTQLELRKNSKYVKSNETIEAESTVTIALMIKGWTPFEHEGREWVYSPATAQEFVNEFDEFRDQAGEIIYERKHFLAGNETTSSTMPAMTLASA